MRCEYVQKCASVWPLQVFILGLVALSDCDRVAARLLLWYGSRWHACYLPLCVFAYLGRDTWACKLSKDAPECLHRRVYMSAAAYIYVWVHQICLLDCLCSLRLVYFWFSPDCMSFNVRFWLLSNKHRFFFLFSAFSLLQAFFPQSDTFYELLFLFSCSSAKKQRDAGCYLKR